MNKREEFLQSLEDLGDLDNECIMCLAKSFVDDVEASVNAIESVLEKVSIDRMNNIEEAYDMLKTLGEQLL